jgi:16S rRNA (cytidine1402-2'-O)-methyltransferase
MISSSLSSSFARALQAAQDAAGAQQHPTHTLYVVATPIGNLADISLRALHVLGLVDAIACEDTRHTRQMLNAYGLERTGHQLLAVHQHNEAEAVARVLERLQAGQRVAYISDAGTPAISDPGTRLVQGVQAAGCRVIPLPGASSVTALLSVSGGLQADQAAFVFVGFLPSKSAERERAVLTLQAESRAQVLLEAPHRMEALGLALGALGARSVTVGRELTKQFEEIVTLPAAELWAWLQASPQRTRGEFALVIHAQAVASDSEASDDHVLRLLLAELPVKTAVKLAAEITGQGRNALYERALALKKDA